MVLGVAVRQGLHEQPQVPGEHRPVVAPLGLGPALPRRCPRRLPRLPGEEAARREDGGGAVADGARPGAGVGDGAVAVAPEIDGGLEHVDGVGEEVGGDRHGGVLEQDALREGEVVPVPEGPAEHLVAGDAVAEQTPVAGDVGATAVRLHRLAEHRGLPAHAVGPQPVDVAGDEVGARLLERRQHPFVRVGRHDVIAVHERQIAAARRSDPRVAGRAEPRVLLLDQPESPVPRGEFAGDAWTPVGGTVVDHDHFEVRHGLLGQ